jgi:RNA polymerase sigma factor (TIGR02999 family)
MTDVTRILNQVELGDPAATEQVLPLVYEELRGLARQLLSHERPGQTIQATALVHEAYLRVLGNNAVPSWENRAHFFAAAAENMRRIFVDRARNKKRIKRGGKLNRVDFLKVQNAIEAPAEDVLAIDEVLERMGQQYPDCAELIKLRFFAGLSLTEAANCIGLAPRSAARVCAFGKAWLFRELSL